LQRATPEERMEFQNVLTPSARTQIHEMHPNLFPRTSLDFLKYAGLVVPPRPLFSQHRANPEKSSAHRRISQIASFIVTPAEAAIAVPCIAWCSALIWPSCFFCVASAAPVAVSDFNAMVSCWNGAGKPWWMPNWIWQPGCVAVLVGQLA
jgi:hypothetical protein